MACGAEEEGLGAAWMGLASGGTGARAGAVLGSGLEAAGGASLRAFGFTRSFGSGNSGNIRIG
jgi:hypothetical protein